MSISETLRHKTFDRKDCWIWSPVTQKKTTDCELSFLSLPLTYIVTHFLEDINFSSPDRLLMGRSV